MGRSAPHEKKNGSIERNRTGEFAVRACRAWQLINFSMKLFFYTSPTISITLPKSPIHTIVRARASSSYLLVRRVVQYERALVRDELRFIFVRRRISVGSQSLQSAISVEKK